jgi:UDP-N-acetylmuramoylalanine--D-glutamate ligase
LELSSYQTEIANSLTPDIAVFTNFTPDHLERHGGIGGYYAAKKRLFISGCPDRSVIGVDEFEGKLLAQELADHLHDDRIIRVSVSRKITNLGWTIFANKGFLSEYRRGKQVASLDLRKCNSLKGSHNHQNACAAYAAVRSLGIGPHSVEKALKSFTGLAHRSQLVTEIRGVVFINDSKATNVDSAMKALETFPKIRWICGGELKEEDISRLNNVLTNVKKAYIIGTNTAKFSSQISCEFEICNTMDRAIKNAFKDAKNGETVLLAPAAASFDQYSSFEERGKAFEREIKKLA